MQKNDVQKISKKSHTSRGWFLAVGGLLLGVLLLVILYNYYIHNNTSGASEIIMPVGNEEAVPAVVITPDGPVLAGSIPARLRIPALTIDVGFVAPLGLLENGEAEVPESDTEVGWYKYGPTPGELGPAVIFGHVDSRTGPAVFFSLGQLEVGDDIFVDREDGTEAHFKVTKLERYPQSAFPTAEVYGDINHAGLRLITCSGIYVRGTARYTHNLVVYAKLVE